MKIEIKNRYTGKVLFSFECDNNTLKKTVIEAVKQNAYLWNANLSNADLSNANLRNADLWNANLSNANLRNADLWNANLSNADLRNANLSNANLSNADLWNANLSNADLSNANNVDKAKKIPMYCKWSHGITSGDLIHIGCEKRTIEEWDHFFNSNEELTTPRNTQEFKQIQAIYEAYKAYLNHLNK